MDYHQKIVSLNMCILFFSVHQPCLLPPDPQPSSSAAAASHPSDTAGPSHSGPTVQKRVRTGPYCFLRRIGRARPRVRQSSADEGQDAGRTSPRSVEGQRGSDSEPNADNDGDDSE